MTTLLVTLPPANLGRSQAIERLVSQLSEYRPDKPLNVKTTLARPDRTIAQNRYLFGVPYAMLVEHGGFTKDEWHEHFCGEMWGRVDRCKIDGTIESRPIRTTTTNEAGEADVVSDVEFWQLVDLIQTYCGMRGLNIPDPDPDYRIKARRDCD